MHSFRILPCCGHMPERIPGEWDTIPGVRGETDQSLGTKASDPLERTTPGAIDEDPYFDENRDEKDEAWVGSNIAGAGDRNKTDAILSCPSCFTVLCMDCQRHETYTDQYRAMFVANCKVHCEYQVSYRPTHHNNKLRWERIAVHSGSADSGEELFYPVLCSYCDTEVAVYDQEEIYHFFNVVTGH